MIKSGWVNMPEKNEGAIVLHTYQEHLLRFLWFEDVWGEYYSVSCINISICPTEKKTTCSTGTINGGVAHSWSRISTAGSTIVQMVFEYAIHILKSYLAWGDRNSHVLILFHFGSQRLR